MGMIDIGGIWHPKIFDFFPEVRYGGSTRLFNKFLGIFPDAPSLYILRKPERLSFSMIDKRLPARFLISLLRLVVSGADPHNIVNSKLVHGDKVINVDEEFMKLTPEERIQRTLDTDGLITNIPGVLLCMSGADCTHVAIFDPVKKAIGIFHSGWRGTAKLISVMGVCHMKKEFGSKPEDLIVSIGPSIGKDDFEVGSDVFFAYRGIYNEKQMKVLFRPDGESKWLLDQPTAIKLQLLMVGVKEKNIEISGFTTTGDNHLFSSARKEGGIGSIDSSCYILCLRK